MNNSSNASIGAISSTPEIHRRLGDLNDAISMLEDGVQRADTKFAPVCAPSDNPPTQGSAKIDRPRDPSLTPLGDQIETLVYRLRTAALRLESVCSRAEV